MSDEAGCVTARPDDGDLGGAAVQLPGRLVRELKQAEEEGASGKAVIVQTQEGDGGGRACCARRGRDTMRTTQVGE